MKKVLFVTIIIALFGIHSYSYATPTLYFAVGNEQVLVADGSTDPLHPDLNPVTGMVTAVVSIQGWTSSVSTGTILGGQADSPYLDLSNLSVTSPLGIQSTLIVGLYGTGYTGSGSFAFNVGGTTANAGSIEFFAMQLNSSLMMDLGPFGPGAFSGTTNGFFNGDDYQLTLLAYITHNASDSYQTSSFDMELQKVPEPTTMLLFGLGLVGVAGVRRFKK